MKVSNEPSSTSRRGSQKQPDRAAHFDGSSNGVLDRGVKTDLRRAVVLAAGKSTRISPVAGATPKPLLEIRGQAILLRNLRWLAASGIEEVWINLHYRPEAIQERIGDGSRFSLRVNYSFEQQLLGTAGGVRRIASRWQDTFLVVYGDNLVQANLELMQQAHREGGAPITIGLFDRTRQPHTGIAGGTVTVESDGQVVSFVEGVAAGTPALVNAGLYLIEPELVDFIPPASFYDFGRDLFPRLLQSAVPINSHIIDGYCLGIDTPEAYQQALHLIDKGTVKL
jgi:mannose-1-phosphate guanylyltransferase